MRHERNDIEADRARARVRENAAQHYARAQQDVGALLDLVGEEVRVHAQRAAELPKDWGFAGDLGRVRQGLKDLLAGLLVGRYDWSETEAARFIDDHLEEMRSA